MRRLALAAIVLSSAAAGAADAQSLAPPPAAATPVLNLTLPPQAGAPAEAAASYRRLEREVYVPGAGPVRLRSGEVRLTPQAQAGPVDSLRVTVGETLRTPGNLPPNLVRPEYDPQTYEVSVIRNWPGALSFDNGAVGVDFSPRAGVGISSLGGTAQAGATLRVGQIRDAKATQTLREMGVRDGAALGGAGRWYLYAAADGRAVGLNMLHGENGWNRGGWTTDPTSALIGDAQVGVGWRKDDIQSSFGLIHREVKGQHMIWGQQTRSDTMVAFSFSLKPQH